MFNIRSIRERVIARMQATRLVSEDAIHDAYSREVAAELHKGQDLALAFRSLINRPRVSHSQQGWVVISREDVARVTELLDGFTDQFRS